MPDISQGPDAGPDQQQENQFTQVTQTTPVIPPYLYSVARWRTQMRYLIYDLPLTVPDGQIVDVSALTALPDSAIDEALRESLAALSEWRRRQAILPPLTLVPGQGVYPLPADFAEAVPETWGALLGADPFLSGQYPGSRDFFRRQSSLRDSALPYGQAGQYGSGIGYAGLWSGGFYAGAGYGEGFPILPQDANGNVIAGGLTTGSQQSRVDFYPASFSSQSPVLVLTPPPTVPAVYSSFTYRAIYLPQRLTVDGTELAWITNADGSLAFTPAYLSQDFVDGTDVLPFSPNGDALRLSLRYGSAWLLMQKIIPLAETDSEKWAFYEVRTGLGRKDLLAVAKVAMDEFNARTKKVPHGGRY